MCYYVSRLVHTRQTIHAQGCHLRLPPECGSYAGDLAKCLVFDRSVAIPSSVVVGQFIEMQMRSEHNPFSQFVWQLFAQRICCESHAHTLALSLVLSLAFITNRPSQFLIFRESRNYAMLCLRYVFGEARVRVFRSYYYIRKRAGGGADGSVEIVIIIAQAPHHQTHHRHHYQHHRQPHRVFSSPTGCFAPRRSLTLSCARALSHTSTLSLSLSPS